MFSRKIPLEKLLNNSQARLNRMVPALGVVVAAFTLAPCPANSVEDTGSLLLDGQSRLEEIHGAIREREKSEREWAEEKIYLGSLINSLKLKNEELEDQLSELGSLVELKEADWRKVESQAARAEEITKALSPEVDSWLHRVKGLIAQAPEYLRIDLGNELEVLDHYSELDQGQGLAHRLETLVSVLERLNEIQTKTTHVIENWKDSLPGGEAVRVIYLGLGTALYQVSATNETGWYRYSAQGWTRVPVKGAGDVFLEYWNALESGTPYGVFNFPFPSKD